jgi:hypothetical protein
LSEMMSDPIVQAVMRRDGITCRDVWKVVEDARQRAGIIIPSFGNEESHARSRTLDLGEEAA